MRTEKKGCDLNYSTKMATKKQKLLSVEEDRLLPTEHRNRSVNSSRKEAEDDYVYYKKLYVVY